MFLTDLEFLDLSLVASVGEVLFIVVADAAHIVAQLGDLLDLAIAAVGMVALVAVLDFTNAGYCIVEGTIEIADHLAQGTFVDFYRFLVLRRYRKAVRHDLLFIFDFFAQHFLYP